MQRTPTTLLLAALLLTAGCTKKPEASDIETGLVDAWSSCTLVKPVNIRKTNGMEDGDSYRMEVAYDLEITQDIAEEDIWPTRVPEPVEVPNNLTAGSSNEEYAAYHQALTDASAPYKQAWQRINDFYANRCPDPVSTEFQQVFGKSRETGYGRSLRQGERQQVLTAYRMVKSENGWLVR